MSDKSERLDPDPSAERRRLVRRAMLAEVMGPPRAIAPWRPSFWLPPSLPEPEPRVPPPMPER